MATKTQMVDFIYSNFSFIGGIEVNKRDLLGKTKEGLTEMIQKNGWETDFKNIFPQHWSNSLLMALKTEKNMLGIVRQTLKIVSGNPWKKMELKSSR